MSSELLKMMEEASESVKKLFEDLPEEQRTEEITQLIHQLEENLEVARLAEIEVEKALKKLEE